MPRYCIEPECNTRAGYNFINEKGVLYCSKHKTDGMIDKVNKRCIKCKIKHSSYNFEGLKFEYCKTCKTDDMVDTKSKMCKFENCKKQPVFNYLNEKNALYCLNHKKDEMVNVVSKKCIECKIKQPVYNKEGLQPEYCGDCKEDGMIDIVSKKCIKCKIKCPVYNKEGLKPEYCGDCKLDGMINVKDKRCKTHLCDTQVKNKYKGYCAFCFTHLFPNEPVSRRYKNKERLIGEYIKEQFKDITLTFDKTIENSCIKRRPDIFIDMGFQYIIVEVDEDQHKDYICENKRLMEIYNALEYRKMVVIRFNPDKYINDNNEKITSCFNNEGKIKKNKKDEWNIRLNKLKECIQKYLEYEIEKSVEIEYLFFNKN